MYVGMFGRTHVATFRECTLKFKSDNVGVYSLTEGVAASPFSSNCSLKSRERLYW